MDDRRRAALVGLLLALLLPAAPAASPAPSLPWDGVRWGESAAALGRQLGARARRLDPPIEFADSYVALALPDEKLGGFPFTIYFQMDKAGGGLKRVMAERQRHGANPRVFRALVAALAAAYGPPSRRCSAGAAPRNGFQGALLQIWERPEAVIRAVFRDTSIEASEGCLYAAIAPCGLTGHLFVQVVPPGPDAESCS